MNKLSLYSGLTYQDLQTSEGLQKVDQLFLEYLQVQDFSLYCHLCSLRSLRAQKRQESNIQDLALPSSEFLLDLARYIESFIFILLGIPEEKENLHRSLKQLSAIGRCRQLFIQKRIANRYTAQDCQIFDRAALDTFFNRFSSEQEFAQHVLRWLEDEDSFSSELKQATHYAAWALYSPDGRARHKGSLLFYSPPKTDPFNLVHYQKTSLFLEALPENHIERSGFNVQDPCPSSSYALREAQYCLYCHKQEKDSCSKGLQPKLPDPSSKMTFMKNQLGEILQGCPLDQKISEMNLLYAQGYSVAALAVITLDNPLVAATGHRICQDCSHACIFQKQEPVDIPAIESRILSDVLDLPWGVEVYHLLMKWNPLNLDRPFPAPSSGRRVLVVGQGPAGFALAHYLLNEGHTVVAIDGLKIEPLSFSPKESIFSIKDHFQSLEERIIAGFGGVAEYGITSRWDKNNLLVIRLCLEKRPNFTLQGDTRFYSQVTVESAYAQGFDHIALCTGAGQPRTLLLPHRMAKGVHFATDFLMSLYLQGAYQYHSLANFPLQSPILVIGGGLTAVDAATEARFFYRRQHQKKKHPQAGNNPENGSGVSKSHFSPLSENSLQERSLPGHPLDSPELPIPKQSLKQEKILEYKEFSAQEEPLGEVTLLYHKALTESPAYRLNAKEISTSFAQGIKFLEKAIAQEIIVDDENHVIGLKVLQEGQSLILPARTILIAVGTTAPAALKQLPFKNISASLDALTAESFLLHTEPDHRGISIFGDCHPWYKGSVVKALASAKKGFSQISSLLQKRPPSPFSFNIQDLEAKIVGLTVHSPHVLEIQVHAPAAVQAFKPGQFFRFQPYHTFFPDLSSETSLSCKTDFSSFRMKGIALTGAWADTQHQILTFFLHLRRNSSRLCRFLKIGRTVSLMGPGGAVFDLPSDQKILLIGEDLGNSLLAPLAQAFQSNNNTVIQLALYYHQNFIQARARLEETTHQVLWGLKYTDPLFQSSRPQDKKSMGDIEILLSHFDQLALYPLQEIGLVIVMGSNALLEKIQKLRPHFFTHQKIYGYLNSPMQCMMQGVCGQCLQKKKDTEGTSSFYLACQQHYQELNSLDFTILKNRLP